MARGSLNFFELYIEKIVLGAVAAFALYVLVAFFILRPNAITYNNQSVGPGELKDEILKSARLLESRVKSAAANVEPVPQFAKQIRNEFQSGVLKPSAGKPALPSTLSRTASFGVPLPSIGDQQEQPTVTLVAPLRPEPPVVSTGRALVIARRPTVRPEGSSGNPDPREPGGTPTGPSSEAIEKVWVTVASWFPVDAQRNEMIAAGYAPYRAGVYFTEIEAQRQELLDSGEWSDWKDVTLSGAMPQLDIPTPAIDDTTGVILNKAEIDEVYRTIKDAQARLAQPKFFTVEAGDSWKLPALEGISAEMFAAKTDLPGAQPGAPPSAAPSDPSEGGPATGAPAAAGAAGGRGSPAAQPTDGRARIRDLQEQVAKAEAELSKRNWREAMNLARAILKEKSLGRIESAAQRVISRAQEGMVAESISRMDTLITHPAQRDKVAIWFHDDSVAAGKTYRYHIRPVLWNRYVGRVRALKNPDEAKFAVIQGDWSLPSAPITVTPVTHYFVASSGLNSSGLARVDVFKWQKGDWLKESFEVGVGDTIGAPRRVGAPINGTVDFSTGATVLDIREVPDLPQRRLTGKKGEFEYGSSGTVVIVYLDPVDGRVKQSHHDKYNSEYERLKDAAL